MPSSPEEEAASITASLLADRARSFLLLLALVFAFSFAFVLLFPFGLPFFVLPFVFAVVFPPSRLGRSFHPLEHSPFLLAFLPAVLFLFTFLATMIADDFRKSSAAAGPRQFAHAKLLLVKLQSSRDRRPIIRMAV